MTYFRDQSLQSAVNSSSYTVSSTPSSPQPPKVFSKLILAVYSTWQGIQVETSSLSTTRHDCTDAWCIAIFIVLCKFWIILVYECFGKITIKLFIKSKFLLLYRMGSRDPELIALSQTSDHLTIQSQSETVAGGTVGPAARNQTWHGHCCLCTVYCCTSVRFLPQRCQITHLYNRHSPPAI